MKRSNAQADMLDQGTSPFDSSAVLKCPVEIAHHGRDALTSVVCDSLRDTGCALTSHERERQDFEKLLSKLSATFVKAAPDEVDTQIDSALQQIVELLGIDRSSLSELTGHGIVVTHSYKLPGVASAARVILGQPFPSTATRIQQDETLLTTDAPLDADPDAGRARYTRATLQSNLKIPLKSMRAVVGEIEFASSHSHLNWPEDFVQRLCLIADIFTNALVRKRADEVLRSREKSLQLAQDELRQLAVKLLHAQEEERRRIAREMHDDWTQRLAILGIEVAKLAHELETVDKARVPLRAMQEELVRLSEDVHALSRHLHPAILDDLGLVEALRSECASFSRRERIAVDYRHDGIVKVLPQDVGLCVYRVAQEALRNIAKHAVVNEAQVTLVVTATQLLLCVQDNGIGFELETLRSHPGLGLSSMNERVRMILAELSVKSAYGQGTTVEVRVPLMGNVS